MPNTLSETHRDIIYAYREVIKKRYDYAVLRQRDDLPASFTEEKIGRFKEYFLTRLYPVPEVREELNDTFANLDTYVKQPNKLLRLLMDSGALLFKYGRHLPKILQAGIKAMQSFSQATVFEDKLVEKANNISYERPLSAEQVNGLIRSLSRKDIEKFIDSSQILFETLQDRKLVKKIKEIIQHLIQKMKNRPNIYSEKELKGLEMGLAIISEGDELFEQLNPVDQKRVFALIVNLEREILDTIFVK